MPLGRGILELFEAIPDRIEVSGHAPTWRVTGGSFESVLTFAREAYGDPVVIAREDRTRWWPRVTLTVTTDPALAAGAPPLETFAAPPPPPVAPTPAPATPVEGKHVAEIPLQREDMTLGVLDEIFTHQEALRQQRLGIPQQRPAGSL